MLQLNHEQTVYHNLTLGGRFSVSVSKPISQPLLCTQWAIGSKLVYTHQVNYNVLYALHNYHVSISDFCGGMQLRVLNGDED